MTKFKTFFSQISTQIAITVSIMCILLFVILNIIVIEQSRVIFKSVIESIKIEQTQGNSPQFTIERFGPFEILREIPYQNPKNFYDLNSDGRFPINPLINQFNTQFRTVLISLSLISVLLSTIIGILVAKIFTSQLNKITEGMINLRNSNYNTQIKRTGTIEFDKLIDEFNTLSNELQKTEELRKDLISDTSHELKTPITSLIGQLEGIKDGVLSVDESRIELLISQVNRLNDLVEQMQEFSRIRNKSRSFEKESFDLKNLIQKIVQSLELELGKNKMSTKIEIDDNFKINGNKEMIERVFINLINNSINYSKGNLIKIDAKDDVIVFKDNGVGVGEEHLQYLFERFYRVEKSRNRKTGGLGIGLSIVKEVIEAHNWKISVKNAEGGGLEFRIELK